MIPKKFIRKFIKSSLFRNEYYTGGYDKLIERHQNQLMKLENTEKFEILIKEILSEEEAFLCSEIPFGVHICDEIYEKKFKKYYNEEEFQTKLNKIVDKGMIHQLENEDNLKMISLPETIIGWFEFLLMRDRNSKYKDEVNNLFIKYLYSVFFELKKHGNFIQLPFRTLIDENIIEKEQCENLLNFESAKNILEQNSDNIYVQQCSCKNIQLNEDEEIDLKDLEVCFILNDLYGKGLEKRGISRKVNLEEALDILDYSKMRGFIQNCDNTKSPSFLCNCDKEYCEIFKCYNVFYHNPLFPSKFSAVFKNLDNCNGCGECILVCPLDLYHHDLNGELVDASFDDCIGCGICKSVCENEVIGIIERNVDNVSKIPDDKVEFMINCAYELKQINKIIFTDNDKISNRLISKIISGFENNFLLRNIFLTPNVLSYIIKQERAKLQKTINKKN